MLFAIYTQATIYMSIVTIITLNRSYDIMYNSDHFTFEEGQMAVYFRVFLTLVMVVVWVFWKMNDPEEWD